MFAAGHQPQAKARLIERDPRKNDGDKRDEHEPVELEFADVDDERRFRRGVLDGGGDVVGVGRGVDGLDDDSRPGGAEQVHRGADEGLVGLEVDAGDAEQRRIHDAEQDGAEQHEQHERCAGDRITEIAHDERAAQRAEHHDALEAEVDDAGMLRKAAAERHENQDGREDQRILQQQNHYASPPFSVLAAFLALRSSCRKIQRFIAVFRNRTNAQR